MSYYLTPTITHTSTNFFKTLHFYKLFIYSPPPTHHAHFQHPSTTTPTPSSLASHASNPLANQHVTHVIRPHPSNYTYILQFLYDPELSHTFYTLTATDLPHPPPPPFHSHTLIPTIPRLQSISQPSRHTLATPLLEIMANITSLLHSNTF